MQYIDTRNESHDFTTEELTALLQGTIKPYPSLWYETEEEILDLRNEGFASDWDDCMTAIASGDSNEDEIEWSEFSMSVEKWQNLYCNR